jgi:AcrR family transcriptional regulator
MLRRLHDLAHLPRRSPDSLRGQDHILDVAEQLFARHGFEATSMRDVAHAAGVNVATLYYQCGSKQEIFDFIFERVVERMSAFVSETFASGGEFEDMAGGIIDRVVEFFARHPSVPRLLERAHLGESREARASVGGYPMLLDTVASELRRQAALGKIRPVDPMPFVQAAAGVIFHLIIDATTLEGKAASRQPGIDDETVRSLQAHARMFILGALGLARPAQRVVNQTGQRMPQQTQAKKGNVRGHSR